MSALPSTTAGKIQTVTARSGRVESYDTLILATGSDPFIIPVPGHDLQGVVSFRDMDDVGAMLRHENVGQGDDLIFVPNDRITASRAVLEMRELRAEVLALPAAGSIDEVSLHRRNERNQFWLCHAVELGCAALG